MSIDKLMIAADRALKVLSHHPVRQRKDSFSESIPLMRANYAGEVAAQGLYLGAWLVESDKTRQAFFSQAMTEEFRHLDWCGYRISELGGKVSVFNPVWFFGACALGISSQALGYRYALGFVSETERQVLAHLQSHLTRLPKEDSVSRDIVETMIAEEIEHAHEANALGASDVPAPISMLMHGFGKILTTISEWG